MNAAHHNKRATRPKDVALQFIATAMLLVGAIVIGYFTDSPAPAVTAAILLAVALLLRTPLPPTARSRIWITLLCAGAMVVFATPPAEGGMTIERIQVRIALIALGIGIAMTFLVQIRAFLHLILFSSWFTTLFGIAGTSHAGDETSWQLPLTVSQLALFVLLTQRINAIHTPRHLRDRGADRRRFARWSVLVPATLLCIAMAATARGPVHGAYRRSGVGLVNFIRPWMSTVTAPGEPNLWQSWMPNSRVEHEVVLRIASPTPPGYLRTAVAVRYERGKWTARRDSATAPLNDVTREGASIKRTFAWPALTPEDTPPPRMSVLPAPGYADEALPVPGTTRAVRLLADSVEGSREGCLVATDWLPPSGYEICLRTGHVEQAFNYPRPRDEGRDTQSHAAALDVSQGIAPCVSQLVATAVGSAPYPPAPVAARKLAEYLDKAFSYKLGVPMKSGGDDPVVQFVRDLRQGHCSMFATVACMCMRHMGYPARLVSGFVCPEQHPTGNYWVVRRAYAHAWVEALDPERDHWFLVEATPPSGQPLHRADAYEAGFLDALHFLIARVRAFLKSGGLSTLQIAVTQAVLSVWRWFLAHPIPATGIVCVGFVLFLWRRRRHAPHHRRSTDPCRRRLERLRRRVERRLRRHGITRRPHETIRDFHGRVSAHPATAHHADWLLRYERVRFQRHVTPEDVAACQEKETDTP